MPIFRRSYAGNIGSLSAVGISRGFTHPVGSVSRLLYMHANSDQASSTRGLVGRCAGEAVTPRLNNRALQVRSGSYQGIEWSVDRTNVSIGGSTFPIKQDWFWARASFRVQAVDKRIRECGALSRCYGVSVTSWLFLTSCPCSQRTAGRQTHAPSSGPWQSRWPSASSFCSGGRQMRLAGAVQRHAGDHRLFHRARDRLPCNAL